MRQYRLDLLDETGSPLVRGVEFEGLECLQAVNEPGWLRFEARAGGLGGLTPPGRWLAEVWQRDRGRGLGWRRLATGIALGWRGFYREGMARLEVNCAGPLWLLGRRIVAWPAGVSGRSRFSGCPAETVMKALVSDNLGPGATQAAGRLLEGVSSQITVEADQGRGAALDWSCAYRNLLGELKRIAALDGSRFELRPAGAWAGFEFGYTPAPGLPLQGNGVVFARRRGNLGEVAWEAEYGDEVSRVVVGGDGSGATRATAVRLAPAPFWEEGAEAFANGPGLSDPAALAALGERKLAEGAAKPLARIEALPVSEPAFGIDYGLGDVVTLANPFTGQNEALQVRRVRLKLWEEGERLELTLGGGGPGAGLEGRVEELETGE